MVSSTIDHLVAVTVFFTATLLFIGLFNQTIQTAVIYQQHRAVATKASDLLDTILLSPGAPTDWGQRSDNPTGFGLQNPEFMQYQLNPFSLMRLSSSLGDPVYYPKANDGAGEYYSNITMDFGSYLQVPFASAVNYSLASRLLGTNNTYGFQLTLTPVVSISITETHASNPLRLSVNVMGTSFPLVNARVNYYLFLVSLTQGQFPLYTIQNGTIYTDNQGSASLAFPDVTDGTVSYSIIATARLGGLNGVGYHQRIPYRDAYIVPLIGNYSQREVLLAHGYDINETVSHGTVSVAYNATFFVLTDDFGLRQVPLDNANDTVINGPGYPVKSVTLPSNNAGILLTTYKVSDTEGGIVIMPWGLSSLSFPMSFGGNSAHQEWVATDIRQVIVNGVAYQAKLALWSYEGYQVNG